MITREDMIVQSVQDHLRAGLTTRDYMPLHVKVRNAFPTLQERAAKLDLTTIATGFNFDDGGTPAEMGSDLIYRVYTVEQWVFATTPEYGQNVANVVKAIFEDTNLVPLVDIRDQGKPVIDQLQVYEPRGLIVQRQIARDPRPWDMNVWTVTVKLEDYYSPSVWD